MDLNDPLDPVPQPDDTSDFLKTLNEIDQEEQRLDEEESHAERLAREKLERTSLITEVADYIHSRFFPSAPRDRFDNRRKLEHVAEFLVDVKKVDSRATSDQFIRNLIIQSRNAGHAAERLSPLDRFYLLVKNSFAR